MGLTTDEEARLYVERQWEEAEADCRAHGLHPFRVEFKSVQWGHVIGQVQSTETAPGTLGHPMFLASIEEMDRTS